MDDGALMETKRFLIQSLRIPDLGPDDIDDDAPLFGKGLGLDSLDALTLILDIDQEYGIEIQDTPEGRSHLRSARALAELLFENRGDREHRAGEPDAS